MAAPVVKTNLTTLIKSPALTLTGLSGTASQDKIVALKKHVVAMSLHIARVKGEILASQTALSSLPKADVEAAVVVGYPPPAQ